MRFTVWGEVRAIGPDGPLQLSGQLRRLLAGLLAGRNGEVGRDDLIAVVWGEDSEPSDAEASLRQYISRLRRALDVAEAGSGRLIVTTPSGYKLEVEPAQVDAGVMAAAVAEGRRPRDLEQLVVGAPFGSYGDEPWCWAVSEHLRTLAATARDLPFERPGADSEVEVEYPDTELSLTSRHHLPNHATSLVGRGPLVARIRELIDKHRLLSLIGPGGIGKTRVAVAVAEEESGRWRDGVWFADLSPITESADVPGRIAAALALQGSVGSAPEALARYLAPRAALLVLDNCEHVIDAAADFAAAVLAHRGSATILATSRERLDIDGEFVVSVPPLETGDDGGPAGALFVERARAIAADPDLGSRSQLVDLCRRLDGLPLAIELAAARTVVLGVPQLVAELDAGIGVLSSGRRRSRRTLSETINWSYQLLDDAEQRLFRALGVFAGGFDLDAVTNVIGSSQTETIVVLEGLVTKSMISPVGSTGRFGIHATMRAFALDQLNAHGESLKARTAHLEHYAQIVMRPRWFYLYSVNFADSCGSDYDNILAAIDYGIAQERWDEVLWLLSAAIGLATSRAASAGGLLEVVDGCLDRLPYDHALAERFAFLRINPLIDAGRFAEAEAASRRSIGHPHRFMSYMSAVFVSLLTALEDPQRALELLDVEVASRPDEMIDDRLVNSTGARAELLALLGRYDESQNEIDRYFRIEDAAGIRQMSGATVASLATVLAWIRNDDDVFDSALFDRYRASDSGFGMHARIARGFSSTLAAISSRAPDIKPRFEAYIHEALSGRDPSEPNLALALLAALAEVEGEAGRAAQLLQHVGPAWYGGAVLARELALRLGMDPSNRSWAMTSEEGTSTAVMTIRAEIERRGWSLPATLVASIDS